ncbi:hypothetical protein [Candidatus Methanoprimaticola sp. MG2]|uniref:hypothetical protein n=1 Tax=Candidatus Methanoprimaticola sp. MG2 TaxID=3228838 RepID=UPI0039C67829
MPPFLRSIKRADVTPSFIKRKAKRGYVEIQAVKQAEWMDERVYQVATGKFNEAMKRLDSGQFTSLGGFHKYLYSQSEEYHKRGQFQGRENIKKAVNARYLRNADSKTLAKAAQLEFLIDNLAPSKLDKFYEENSEFLDELYEYESPYVETPFSNTEYANIDYLLNKIKSFSNKKNLAKSEIVYTKELENQGML